MCNRDDLVSIIVPVYNKENKIADCLNSVLNQTYTNLEIIVIDDGSTDKSSSICDEFARKDNRIIVRHMSNGGVGKARNTGMELAKGEFIQFVDADDYIDRRMVEKLYIHLVDSNTDMCICGYKQIIDGRVKGYISPCKEGAFLVHEYIKMIDEYHLDPLCGSPCNKLFRKEIIEKNCVLFDIHLSFAEDFKFVMDYLCKCKNVYFIKRCFYNYNLDVEASLSKVTKQRIDDAWMQQIMFCRYLKKTYIEEGFQKISPNSCATIYFNLVAVSLYTRLQNCQDRRNILFWLRRSVRDKKMIEYDLINIKYNKCKSNANYKMLFKHFLFTKLLYIFARIGMEAPLVWITSMFVYQK